MKPLHAIPALIFASLLLAASTAIAQLPAPPSHTIKPAALWLDTGGHPIDAHGGGVLYFNGTYFWYGEHKIPGKSEDQKADGGIHAYSSSDLVNWKDEGVVFSVDYAHPNTDVSYGCILERPKVLFDPATSLFTAYFKLYPPGDQYVRGYVGTATATTPTGPFHYQGKSLAGDAEFGTGDFALFEDSDGSIYHLGVRKPDRAFVLGKLSESRAIAPASAADGVEVATEAPAIVHHANRYYLLGSGSTGYAANAARSFVADSIKGPYQPLGNFVEGVNSQNHIGPELTFGGQISFVIPIHGKPDAWIAMFDIWTPKVSAEARYIWLPLTFEHGKPVVRWLDEWDPTTYFASSH